MQNHIDLKDLYRRRDSRADDVREPFFRDLTAIIHSYPFRRLKHKTQVFFAPQNDHICTRIEHVMHVATIAVTICNKLGLNTDLAWAISVGHDLGHTPFGHTGESIISDLIRKNGGYGFCHEINSLRVVDYLINDGKGINLSYGVRDGIINHCGEKFEQFLSPSSRPAELDGIRTRTFLPCTWEGIVVRMSDKIAYMGRDLEDAISLRIVSKDDIPVPVLKNLGAKNGEMIDTMVKDVITNAGTHGMIGFSDPVYEAMLSLHKFNISRIYTSSHLVNYHQYIERIIRTLWHYLSEIFDRHGFDTEKYASEKTTLAGEFGHYLGKMKNFYMNVEKSHENIIQDYVSGMTDTFAIDSVKELFNPPEQFR